jgi:acid phosphatase
MFDGLNRHHYNGERRRLALQRGHALAAVFVVATLSATQLARATECPPVREPNIAMPDRPLNIDNVKAILRDYHKKDYPEDVAAVLADARAYVEQRASEVTNPALVLDIDETSLTNWPNLDVNDFGFIANGGCQIPPISPCGFNAWVRHHTAEAITPTRILFNAAKAKGVAVFFISGRHEADRKVTILNLKRQGYRGWTKLVLRTDNDKTRTVEDYKTEERSKIEATGYKIIANVGDQESDLKGGFADCTFKMPNPFYLIR